MSLNLKTVSGYRDALFPILTKKIETAITEVRKKHLEYSEEELIFAGHMKAFNEITTTKAYTREEMRGLILSHYFTASPEIDARISMAVASVIDSYPERSDALTTKSQGDFSVQISGKMYCKKHDSEPNCLIPNECIKGVMGVALPIYQTAIANLSNREVADIISTTVMFAKHEKSKRIRIERSAFGDKPIMAFSSPETLKGFAIRQSVPLSLNVLLRERLKREASASGDTSDKQ
ncbi:MAG: hypothetical protein J6J23_06860 [Clostridia bacterium]|nr:hypothetical protein [Clostridia bacterium]